MQKGIITIFGGTGFVGRHVVQEAARAGYRVQVITRDTIAAEFLKTQGDVGQIAIIYGDIRDPESYRAAVARSNIVINLVGILYEKGKQTFATLHAKAPETLAQMAIQSGVERFLHMSALGVDKATNSKYAKTKLLGEKAVLAAFPDATIFRPSVIFGAEDNFYNQFAKMACFSPFLPLIGGGNTKFQPTYVGDVAKALIHALSRPESKGAIYSLGGGKVLSFEAILRSVGTYTHRTPWLLPLPSCAASMMGLVAERLPHPFITRDQVRLLAYDNVVDETEQGYAALGIIPHSPEDIVPEYLVRFARMIPH
jgi:NADH dehydrogenase